MPDIFVNPPACRTLDFGPPPQVMTEEEYMCSFRADLGRALNARGEDTQLRKLITAFKDTFPKLSLWERFKDFFGMSNTADNRRDAAILFIANQFQSIMQDANMSAALARTLRETKLTPVQDAENMEELTARTLARLLERTPSLAQAQVHLTDLSLKALRGKKIGIQLYGRVSWGGNVPVGLQGVSLPFQVQAEHPLTIMNNLIWVKSAPERARALTTLFEALPRQERLALQLLYSMDAPDSEALLFSPQGLLSAEMRPKPKPKPEPKPKPKKMQSSAAPRQPPDELIALTLNRASKTNSNFVQECIKDMGQVKELKSWDELSNRMSFGEATDEPFKFNWAYRHIINAQTSTPVSTLKSDLHRGDLSHMVITVDKIPILPKVTLRMQAAATTMYERGVMAPLPKQDRLHAGGVAGAWCKILQDSGMGKDTARMVTAAVIYSICQGGAGASIARFIPKTMGFYDESKIPAARHSALCIDTTSDSPQVMMAEFTSSRHYINPNSGKSVTTVHPDLRIGGVSFQLPCSKAESASDMAAEYMTKDIQVTGFGRRDPEVVLKQVN